MGSTSAFACAGLWFTCDALHTQPREMDMLIALALYASTVVFGFVFSFPHLWSQSRLTHWIQTTLSSSVNSSPCHKTVSVNVSPATPVPLNRLWSLCCTSSIIFILVTSPPLAQKPSSCPIDKPKIPHLLSLWFRFLTATRLFFPHGNLALKMF
jgi:hypothetical protein